MISSEIEHVIAKSSDGELQVGIVPKSELPLQRPPQDEVLDLIDSETLLKIFRKFKLKRDQIEILTRFYENEDEVVNLDGNYTLQKAFVEVEKTILDLLKNEFSTTQHKLKSVFKGRLALGLQGASASGKTWAAVDILCSEEYRNTKLFVFSAQPNDQSLKRLKTERPKSKTILIDVDKIGERDITLNDFSKNEDAIILVDDIFDAYPEKNEMRKTMVHLVRSILVKGRHHKSRRSQKGLGCVVIFHRARQGQTSNTWYSELRDIIVFPKSNSASTVEWLRSKYHLQKKFLDRLFKRVSGRGVHFHLHNPMYVVAENFVQII